MLHEFKRLATAVALHRTGFSSRPHLEVVVTDSDTHIDLP